MDEIKNLGDITPQLGAALDQHFYAGAVAIQSTDAVSPQVGADLRNRAIYVTLIACAGMMLFVANRFKPRFRRRDTWEKLTNDAINETMSRTVITHGPAFLTVLALVFFGGDVLKSFSCALFIDVVVSTYSMICIASPMMLAWEQFKAKRHGATASGPNAAVALGGGAASLEMAGAMQRKKRKKKR